MRSMREPLEERKARYAAQYEELAIRQTDATEAGDYRKANKAHDQLEQLFKRFRDDSETANELLSSLLKSADDRVRSWAASHCLSLKINIPEAENVLREVSEKSKFPLLGFTAEKTLEVWKKQGYL